MRRDKRLANEKPVVHSNVQSRVLHMEVQLSLMIHEVQVTKRCLCMQLFFFYYLFK